MHLFTVTICTDFFLEDYDDLILEEAARLQFDWFKEVIVDITPLPLEYEVYWRRGCIITDIVISCNDNELFNMYAELEDEFKKTVAYQKLLKKLQWKLENLPDVPEVYVKTIRFQLVKFRIAQEKLAEQEVRNLLNNLV